MNTIAIIPVKKIRKNINITLPINKNILSILFIIIHTPSKTVLLSLLFLKLIIDFHNDKNY